MKAGKPKAKRSAPGKPAPKKPAAKKPAAKRPAPRKPAPNKRTPNKPAARTDFGDPIDGFFIRQPAQLRPILERLRQLVEAVAPDADSSIKWGMPFFSVGGTMMCALGAHRSHVNLIMAGPPEAFDDPHGRLSGEGKTGRHLKLTSLAGLPRLEVQGWLRIAADLARRPR